MRAITIEKTIEGNYRVKLWSSEAVYQEMLLEQERNVIECIQSQLGQLEPAKVFDPLAEKQP